MERGNWFLFGLLIAGFVVQNLVVSILILFGITLLLYYFPVSKGVVLLVFFMLGLLSLFLLKTVVTG